MAENNEPLETISVSKSSLMTFVYGGLLVALVLGGFYYYTSTQPNGSMTDDLEENVVVEEDNQMDDEDSLMEDDTDKTNNTDDTELVSKLDDSVVNGKISGKLCYPSTMLPAGEIAVKNLDTNSVNEIPYGGIESNYAVDVAPGKYVLRYQANTGEGDEYMSGYYTLCGNDGSYETCSKDESHDLIEVEVDSGETVTGIDLCDFYYEPTEEPEF